jgi:hypothetical protein
MQLTAGSGECFLGSVFGQVHIGQPTARDPDSHRVVTFIQSAKTVEVAAAGRLH